MLYSVWFGLFRFVKSVGGRKNVYKNIGITNPGVGFEASLVQSQTSHIYIKPPSLHRQAQGYVFTKSNSQNGVRASMNISTFTQYKQTAKSICSYANDLFRLHVFSSINWMAILHFICFFRELNDSTEFIHRNYIITKKNRTFFFSSCKQTF